MRLFEEALSITDIKGSEIYRKEISQFKGAFQEDFDFSNQESGIYFFNIDAKGERNSHKIILQ